jgi:amino acid adenylation domain-containing protein
MNTDDGNEQLDGGDGRGGALYGRFLRGLDTSPTRTALRVGTDLLTYEEIHHRALLWAGSLLAATREPPAAVGVLAGKEGVDAYVAILAALYTGAAVVPLHPDFPRDRTRAMLAAAGVSALVGDGNAAERVAGDLPVLALGTGGLELAAPVPVSHRDALAEPRPVRPGDPAFVLFTSGSTGRPKGVPVSHGSTHHYFAHVDRHYDFGPEDIFSQTFDLNFDCAVFDLFAAWGAGASVHAVPAYAYRDLPEFVAERAMTVWFSTPSAIALVGRLGGLAPEGMPTLRWSLFAGEALRQRDAERWQAAAPVSTVENIYGPTELTITITGHRWSPADSPALCVNGLVPIGTVHTGHREVLLDHTDTATETEGELCIAGPQLTAGYLDPADGAGRFLERDGATWYRTGDRVRRLDNGELVYVGRLDGQVQIQGWRVELAEIEHALRSCGGVEDAVAVTRPTEQGLELVVYYTGAPASATVLSTQLRDLLPAGMLPRDYRHVAEFPLNPNRKIDRRALATAAAADPRGR